MNGGQEDLKAGENQRKSQNLPSHLDREERAGAHTGGRREEGILAVGAKQIVSFPFIQDKGSWHRTGPSMETGVYTSPF